MADQRSPSTARYRTFGDLVVHTAEGAQVLTRRRERDTLAVLLAVRGPVSADRLLGEVWDAGAALGSLQAVVSRLRNVLERGRTRRSENRCLVSTSAGYAVRAAVEDVDVWAYEDLAQRCLASGGPADALALFEQAEALWTGPPYADCANDSVTAARTRLVDLRASVTERTAQALLDLGRPEQAGLVLGPRAEEHPFRERVFALTALAQYRCGRQSEALATLRGLRRRLADELGVDPTPDVRRLEDDLLQHSADLDGPATTVPSPAASVDRSAVASPSPAPTPVRSADELIGREAALARVEALLDRLPHGPVVLSVLGEPGIGKTRLVEEVLARSAARGLTGVVGQCHQGDVAPALWPWTQVVRALAAYAGGTDPLLVPLLDDEAPVDTGSGSLRLFDAVAGLVESTARDRGGLVVVLEDLHWADATSLQLLSHLVERRSDAPLALVVTRRSTEEHGAEAMLAALAALARAGAERLRLDGLDRDDVGRLLGHLLARPAGELPADLVRVVDEATAGNAFFVREYARLLQAQNTVGDLSTVGDLPVPDGVRDVIGQRVDRLPADTRDVLRAAAVLGRDIEPQDVADLAGQLLDDVLDHLDLTLASGLLEERGGGYAFAHALTREALYADLSAARRVRSHARAADVLAQRAGDDPDSAAVIAHHALLAAPLGPDRARTAFTWLGRAARVAQARQAPTEARALWLRARRIAEELGLQDERLHAMLGVARSAVRMGTFTEAPVLVKELAHEARRLGHWDLVAAAAATFQSAGAWTWRIHGSKDEGLIEVFTAALDHVGSADEATLCATLTIEHQFGWDTPASDAYAARAISAARTAGDHELLCSALLVRLIASAGRADLGDRSRLARELLDERPGPEVEVAALIHLGFALHEEGRVREAEQLLEDAQRKAAVLTHSGLDVPLAWWRAAVATDHDAPDARRVADEALALHLRQDFYYGTELQTLHAVLYRDPGTPVVPAVLAGAASGLHAERVLVAWALVEAGDLDGAATAVGEAPPDHAIDYSIHASLCLRLLVAAALGRPGEVAEMLRRIDRYAQPLAVYGSVSHLGSFDHFRAVGHRSLGDLERALELARRAVETNRRCDIRPWLRRSEQLLAELEDQLAPGEAQVRPK